MFSYPCTSLVQQAGEQLLPPSYHTEEGRRELEKDDEELKLQAGGNSWDAYKEREAYLAKYSRFNAKLFLDASVEHSYGSDTKETLIEETPDEFIAAANRLLKPGL